MSLLQSPPKRLTVEEYERMGRDGIFDSDLKVELLNGVIFPMSPIGFRHVYAVNELTEFFCAAAKKRFSVGPGNPFLLDLWSEPEPDLVLVSREVRQLQRHAKPEEIYLVVEVSDSSLDKDKRIKAPAYARQGIAEYWIVNLVKDQLEVYRRPCDGKYPSPQVLKRGATISPLAFPDIVLQVGELFA